MRISGSQKACPITMCHTIDHMIAYRVFQISSLPVMPVKIHICQRIHYMIKELPYNYITALEQAQHLDMPSAALELQGLF